MRFTLKPIFKDIAITFATELLVLISFFLIYRLLANNFGPEGVGKYSLVRRVIGFLQPLLLLGLSVGIPRYIALSKNKEETNAYMKSGSLAILSFTLIFILLVNLYEDYFAELFFGNLSYLILIFPLTVFLLGLNMHSLVYSYFRGKLSVRTFNLLQTTNMIIVPIAILSYFKNVSIEYFITLSGAITLIISLIFGINILRDIIHEIDYDIFWKSSRKLLIYSTQRIPADFSLALLFSLGPIAASRFVSIEEVGYLAVSQSLLNAVGTIIAPLGLIILPKVSNMIRENKKLEIADSLNIFMGAVIQCSVFISFQMILFSDAIINFWLGPEFIKAVPVMQIVFISVVFYTIYVGMRSILDAIEFKPLNTVNLLISLMVFVTSSCYFIFIYRSLPAIYDFSIAFSLSVSFLGILTYVSIRKIYPRDFLHDMKYLFIALVFNVFIAIIAVMLRPAIISEFYYVVAFEVFAGLFYLLILWQLKMKWIIQLPKKILKKF